MNEHKTRSLAKVVSWRLLGLIFWPTVSYMVTGSWVDTGILTGAFVFMTLMYYVHERIWDKVKWGRDE